MDAPEMVDGPVTIKKVRCRKWSKPQQYLCHCCGHRTFIACLVGFYSCRWKDYQQRTIEPGRCCCSMGECTFFMVLVLTFSSWFTFLYMWGEAKNDYHNLDGYVYEALGFWFRWTTLILMLSSFFFAYLLFLVVLAVFLVLESQQLCLHRSHKITAPFLHVTAIFIMILLAWPVSLHFFRMKNKVLQVLILGPYLSILLFLLFIPLGMYSPCIREKGTLGPKPGLIGHRGAPMVAPENTEMSFLKTIHHGGIGLETDVTISFDGVPFLMHDRTLKRTTNVDEAFPALGNLEAAFFTWPVLEKLNAGKWFFEKRPFFGMPKLSRKDKIWAKSQKIYKLTDFVKLANKENKYIIFDLYRPPKDHPYREKYIHRVLEVLLNDSAIKPELVLWLPSRFRHYVHARAPGFKQTASSADSLEDLQFWNIVKINLDYRHINNIDIQKYAEANITTNFWVISEPWLFSLAWCYGVHSVTTNAVHSLNKLKKPFFLMTPREYRTMWIMTDVVAIVFICAIFIYFWWNEAGRYHGGKASGTKRGSNLYNEEAELNRLPTVA